MCASTCGPSPRPIDTAPRTAVARLFACVDSDGLGPEYADYLQSVDPQAPSRSDDSDDVILQWSAPRERAMLRRCIPYDAWRDLLTNMRADIVIDCAAVLGRSGDLIELLRPGGRFVAVGYSYEDRVGLDYCPFVTTEKEIVGCRGATMDDLRAAIDMVIARDVELVVTRRQPLVDANAALEHVASRGHVGRTVLDVAA